MAAVGEGDRLSCGHFALTYGCNAATCYAPMGPEKKAAHPAPWRWVFDGILADANAKTILSTTPGVPADVKALIAAAPAMAALLRDLHHVQNAGDLKPEIRARISAIVAELDATSKS